MPSPRGLCHQNTAMLASPFFTFRLSNWGISSTLQHCESRPLDFLPRSPENLATRSRTSTSAMLLAACLPLAAAYSFSAPGAHMRALVQPVVQGRSVANVAMAVKTASIAMPALSSTMTEGKISEWLVSVGDKVSSGDMVLVVESDKADMDVETYEEGFIAKILVGEGEVAPVGAPVAILCDSADDIDAAAAQGAGGAPAAEAEPAAAAPAAAAPAAVRARSPARVCPRPRVPLLSLHPARSFDC